MGDEVEHDDDVVSKSTGGSDVGVEEQMDQDENQQKENECTLVRGTFADELPPFSTGGRRTEILDHNVGGVVNKCDDEFEEWIDRRTPSKGDGASDDNDLDPTTVCSPRQQPADAAGPETEESLL